MILHTICSWFAAIRLRQCRGQTGLPVQTTRNHPLFSLTCPRPHHALYYNNHKTMKNKINKNRKYAWYMYINELALKCWTLANILNLAQHRTKTCQFLVIVAKTVENFQNEDQKLLHHIKRNLLSATKSCPIFSLAQLYTSSKGYLWHGGASND